MAPLINAVRFSFILQNVGLLWLGGSQQGVTDLLDSQNELFNFLGIPVTNADVLAIGVTTPLVIGLTTFVRRSRLGKAVRAHAPDTEAARLMGVDADTTTSLSF